MHAIRIALSAMAVGLAFAAQAGVYIETQDVPAGAVEQVRLHRIYIQDGAARIEHSHGDDAAQYVVFKNDQLFAIDTAKKRYTILDHESAQAIGSVMDSAMDQMRKELARLKPEQRAAVEQMLGRKAGTALSDSKPVPIIAAKDTGKAETLNGIACQDWEITRDGTRSEELCVAPFSSVPGKEDFLGLARRMQSLLQDLTGALAQVGGSVEDLALMEKVQGFPVRVRHYDESGELQGEIALKRWREEVFPAETFEVPAGYARRDLKSELARK